MRFIRLSGRCTPSFYGAVNVSTLQNIGEMKCAEQSAEGAGTIFLPEIPRVESAQGEG
jgi:hypothetical protein